MAVTRGWGRCGRSIRGAIGCGWCSSRPGAPVLNMPDNLTMSPRGGLVICEDGTMTPCVHGLTTEGRIFRFARNNIKIDVPRNGLSGDYSQREFAGAAYSPDGRWLFFNASRRALPSR